MSSSTSMYYGFGFEVDNIKTLDLVTFMTNHKRTLCESIREREMFDVLHNTEDGIFSYNFAQDFFEEWDYECDVSGQSGLGAIISNVISRETGVRVEYQMGQSDCGSVPSVLLVETSPWNYNEKEKNLTINSLTELLLPYVLELGLSKKDIDFLSIEYYG